jgi:hypothetical protein
MLLEEEERMSGGDPERERLGVGTKGLDMSAAGERGAVGREDEEETRGGKKKRGEGEEGGKECTGVKEMREEGEEMRGGGWGGGVGGG